MTPEGKVKAKVKKVLDKIGAWYFMPVSGGFGRHGIPDFIACDHGKFIAIECKARGGKLTGLQKKTLDEISEAGGCTIVLNDLNIDEWTQLMTR